MPIQTKRLRDPIERDDGFRLLIARYRPRGVRKGDETWNAWDKRLAPSAELHAAYFGRRRAGARVVERGLPSLAWEDYVARFLEEMQSPAAAAALDELRERAASEVVTLLCYCEDERRCHRGLVRQLVERKPAR